MRMTILCLWILLLSGFTPVVFALTDSFDDGDATDWTPIQGDWSVQNESYAQESSEWTTTTTHETYHRSYFGAEDWTDYTLEATVRIETEGDLAPIVGVFFRVTEKSDAGDYYYFRLDARPSEGPGLIKAPNVTMQINNNQPAQPGRDYILRVELSGSNIKCYVDGQLEIDLDDGDFPQGAVGVGTFNAGGVFDDITVTGEGIPTAVSPQSKLAQTWGHLKRQY